MHSVYRTRMDRTLHIQICGEQNGAYKNTISLHNKHNKPGREIDFASI